MICSRVHHRAFLLIRTWDGAEHEAKRCLWKALWSMGDRWRKREGLWRRFLPAACWKPTCLSIFKWVIINFSKSCWRIQVGFLYRMIRNLVSWPDIAHVDAWLIWFYKEFWPPCHRAIFILILRRHRRTLIMICDCTLWWRRNLLYICKLSQRSLNLRLPSLMLLGHKKSILRWIFGPLRHLYRRCIRNFRLAHICSFIFFMLFR